MYQADQITMQTTDYNKILQLKGKPLDNAGVNGVGLEKKYSILAINELKKTHTPILGGDVFRFIDG